MPPDGLPLQTCLENLEEMVSRAKQNRRKCVVVLQAARQLVQGFQQSVRAPPLPIDPCSCRCVGTTMLVGTSGTTMVVVWQLFMPRFHFVAGSPARHADR